MSSFSTASEFFGTSHADDLLSLFPMRKVAFYSAIPTEKDMELTKVMSLMWANFAKTGLVIVESQYRTHFTKILSSFQKSHA